MLVGVKPSYEQSIAKSLFTITGRGYVKHHLVVLLEKLFDNGEDGLLEFRVKLFNLSVFIIKRFKEDDYAKISSIVIPDILIS